MTSDAAPSPRDSSRGRGRPTVIDPQTLSEAALRVFLEKGYAAATWADIAEASGVSVRSLSRHFSSKSELALIGISPGWEEFTRILRETPGDDLDAVMRYCIYAGLQGLTDAGSAGLNWVRLVAREPQLVAEIRSANAPWVLAMKEKVASLRPDLSPALCQAVAGAYDAAVFAGLDEWAAHEVGQPSEAVDRLLKHLEIRASATSTEAPGGT